MNIVLSLNQISSLNIGLLESKTNIIMSNGQFTKINFVDANFTMNGLYINFPLSSYTTEVVQHRKNMKFVYSSSANIQSSNDLALLEQRLLDFYSNNKQRDYRKKLLLKQQIESGFMKIYKETHSHLDSGSMYIIKISGIWESNGEIGITYKLYEAGTVI
jgi:hypothetical protein|uniref:Uncharacterized protein n=1 Tax=viral metagenome TaxID=1070528 RepID=A0A6C0IMS7_9ZZZZ